MIISEERCPGVYGKWAHVNQCGTDLEGALGCLIYCLSTSLGGGEGGWQQKKGEIVSEKKGEERRKGKGGLNTKALVPEAVCSIGNIVDVCSQACCCSPLPKPVFCCDALGGLRVAGSSPVAWEDWGS